MKAWQIPIRVVNGLFLLHTGLSKRNLPPEQARELHALAVTAYPMLRSVDAQVFAKSMAAGELALATSLLVPIVPSAVGGAGLSALGGALIGLYWRAPGLRNERSIRPTPIGLSVAKDWWLAAMGAAIVIDAALDRRTRAHPRRPLARAVRGKNVPKAA